MKGAIYEQLNNQIESANKILAELETQEAMLNNIMQNFENRKGIAEKEKSKVLLFRAKLSRVINLAKKGDGSHITALNELFSEYGSSNKK